VNFHGRHNLCSACVVFVVSVYNHIPADGVLKFLAWRTCFYVNGDQDDVTKMPESLITVQLLQHDSLFTL